jgi:hypothetical protein
MAFDALRTGYAAHKGASSRRQRRLSDLPAGERAERVLVPPCGQARRRAHASDQIAYLDQLRLSDWGNDGTYPGIAGRE